MEKNTHALWHAGPYVVHMITSSNAAGVRVKDKRGKLMHFAPFQWGPSKADAFNMALHTGNPLDCMSAMAFYFMRIDQYVDGPGFLDAWKSAKLLQMGPAYHRTH